jgi:hypothetical protein
MYVLKVHACQYYSVSVPFPFHQHGAFSRRTDGKAWDFSKSNASSEIRVLQMVYDIRIDIRHILFYTICAYFY